MHSLNAEGVPYSGHSLQLTHLQMERACEEGFAIIEL